jgi:hypothetical protein
LAAPLMRRVGGGNLQVRRVRHGNLHEPPALAQTPAFAVLAGLGSRLFRAFLARCLGLSKINIDGASKIGCSHMK